MCGVQYDEKLCNLLDTYDKLFLVHADNVGSKQFQDIRRVSHVVACTSCTVSCDSASFSNHAHETRGSLVSPCPSVETDICLCITNQGFLLAANLPCSGRAGPDAGDNGCLPHWSTPALTLGAVTEQGLRDVDNTCICLCMTRQGLLPC